MNLFNKILNSNKKQIGDHYETFALEYLQRQGLHLVESNFVRRGGEIDLIMRHHDCIVFIEVKYRRNNHYGHAVEMVTSSKQRKLIKTAILWLKMNNLSTENTHYRFDVIAIQNQGNDINWVQNAITEG